MRYPYPIRTFRQLSVSANFGWIFVLCLIISGSAFSQDATPTSITLHWSAPGDDGNIGTAAEYDLRYDSAPITAGNFASATSVSGEPAPQTAGSPESFTVIGLNPSTTYYFAIRSIDESGNISDLSNVVARTTLDEQTAPMAAVNLQAGNPTSTTIIVAWTAPGDDSASGTASQYNLRYSLSPITENNFGEATEVSGLPSPQVAGSTELVTVSNLAPGTTYYFALKSADEVPNWSGLSNIADGTTLSEQSAPAAIAGLTIDSTTATGAFLSWTAPGDDGMTGTATSYDIRYSESPITESSWDDAIEVAGEPAPLVAGSGQSYFMSGLTANSTYYFAIKTVDDVGNISLISNIASGTTADNVPPAAIQDLSSIYPADTIINLILLLG